MLELLNICNLCFHNEHCQKNLDYQCREVYEYFKEVVENKILHR